MFKQWSLRQVRLTIFRTEGRISSLIGSYIGAPSPQPLDITLEQGGKSAIWQAGMALAVDTPNNRVYFATGFVFFLYSTS
jgi:hypothetical protein